MYKNNITVLILCALLFSSCAYYNTFHNTKKLYKEAVKEREKRKGDKVTPAEKRKYDNAIKQASKVLELYPNSKYVDDALLILGECLFYKRELISAQRKFKELITYFPESSYYYQAELWLARVDIELMDYASARVILNKLLNKNKLKNKIREESRFLLGEIHFKQEDYAAAEIEYSSASGIAKSDITRTKAYFQAGRCQLLLNKNKEAVASFRQAIKSSPDNRTEFDARLYYARALKQAGEFITAARVCNQLLENQQNKEYFGQVQLEIADIVYWEGKALYEKLISTDLQFKGKIKEALDKYEIVLLQNKRTAVAAAAYYKIAQIKEKDLHDFAGAQESYQKVMVEYNRSEYAKEASQRAKDIADLIRLNNLVKKAQGEQLMATRQGQIHHFSALELLLLEHGVHPELRFMNELTKQSLAAADSGAQSGGSGKSNHEQEELASAKKRDQLVASKLQLAEIYMFRFGQIDSALVEYRQVIELFGDHPGAAKALYSCAYIYEHEYHNKFKMDSLLYELIQKYPLSKQAQEAVKKLGLEIESDKEPAAVLFDRAEKALFSSGNIPEALTKYRNIADVYPDSHYAPLALYAIGWIFENLTSENQSAVEAYREVLEKYPDFVNKSLLSRKLASYEKGLPEEVAQVAKVDIRDSKETPIATKPTLVDDGEKTNPAPAPTTIVTRDRRPKIVERLRSGKPILRE